MLCGYVIFNKNSPVYIKSLNSQKILPHCGLEGDHLTIPIRRKHKIA